MHYTSALEMISYLRAYVIVVSGSGTLILHPIVFYVNEPNVSDILSRVPSHYISVILHICVQCFILGFTCV